MAEKHHGHGGHRYMTNEERAHKRYGKTSKSMNANTAPPPPAEGADGMPSGGAPLPPGVPAGAAPTQPDATQAMAAAAMGPGGGPTG